MDSTSPTVPAPAIPSFTTVVAVDERKLPEWRLTWPTWRKNKPELLERPLLVIVDGARGFSDFSWLDHPDVVVRPWTWRPELPQRERMLSAFVKLPGFFVETDYWLKLDLDSIAITPGPWIDPEWFADEPCIISRPWSYTKPASWIAELHLWASQHPQLMDYPPLAWRPVDPAWECYKQPRIISQQGFFRTDFTRHCSNLCPDRLPVPSQDTLQWYVCELERGTVRRVRFNGWTNRATRRGIQMAVEEAMRK